MREVEWEGSVGPEDAGVRLDQFLAEPLGSRARAARVIAAGLVAVEGRSVRKRHQVSAGQRVVVQQEAFEAQCLRAALTRHKGDVKAVLEELQLPRRTFNEKMQRHGLSREMFVPGS